MVAITIILIYWVHFVSSLDTLSLIEKKSSLKIVDLQSDYCREVYGYIKDSILLSNEASSQSDLAQAVGSSADSKMVIYVPNCSPDERFQSLNLTGLTKFTGKLTYYVQAGGQVEFPKTISFKALLASLNGESSVPVTVIDVRTEAEIISTGALPTAINIPIAQIGQVMSTMDPNRFQALYGIEKPKKESENPRNQNVVLSCRSGGRARAAAAILNKLGFDFRVYPGSFEDWKKNDGPLVF